MDGLQIDQETSQTRTRSRWSMTAPEEDTLSTFPPDSRHYRLGTLPSGIR